ncbi:putative protein EIN4-like [Capsicum annuum]|nr:putative protein EIN4-like [Capsicum annuum]
MIFLKNQITQCHIPLAHPIDRLEFRVKDDDVFGARVMGKATISAKKIVHGEVISGFSLSILQVSFRVKYVTGIAQEHSGSLNCGVLIAIYAEYLSEGLGIPSSGIDSQYHPMRYATILCKYGSVKAEKGYFSENDDPPRPMSSFTHTQKKSLLCILSSCLLIG